MEHKGSPLSFLIMRLWGSREEGSALPACHFGCCLHCCRREEEEGPGVPRLTDSAGWIQSEPRLLQCCLKPRVQDGPQLWAFLPVTAKSTCFLGHLPLDSGAPSKSRSLRTEGGLPPPPPPPVRQLGHRVWLPPERAHLSAALWAMGLQGYVDLF